MAASRRSRKTSIWEIPLATLALHQRRRGHPEDGERQQAMPLILSTVWTGLGMEFHIRCTLLNQGVFVDVAFIDEDVI